MSTIALYRKRITRSLEGCKFRLCVRLCLFEEQFCLSLFGFLIALPFLDRWHRHPHEMMEAWGFYFDEHDWSFVWCWGDWSCRKYHPLRMQHHSWHVLRPDGTWAKRVQSYEKGEPDGRREWVLPYHYKLRSGEVQERMATVFVERGEWRRRWIGWLPMFRKIRQSIKVCFNDEVGESTGSWKGGCIGCGYDMKPGETAEQTLRRMERERTFR
jgi:hypothetical protein